MTTNQIFQKYGLPGRNELFYWSPRIDAGDGNDYVFSPKTLFERYSATYIGGPGSDIFETYGNSGNQQPSVYTNLIIGDTGREADVAAPGSGADHILGFFASDIILSGGGNDYVNALDGNDEVYGGAGEDYLIGGQGADQIAGDAGNDYLFGSSPQSVSRPFLTIILNYNGDNDALIAPQTQTGKPGAMATDDVSADTLDGGAGNDVIDGGRGADRMTGGLGNDIFYVDNADDKVLELVSQGTDTVLTSVSYALAVGQHIEALATTSTAGTGAMSLVGNEFAQRILGNNGANALYGNGGNDALFGYAGNDVLAGGAGNDTLTGGPGYDHFVFNTAPNRVTNVDRIVDFSVPQDTIRLDNAVMPGLGAALGVLSPGKFWKSTAGLAHDADDRIIYETDTGKLFYDANGSAAGGAVHIATLAANLALTHADFAVI